MASKFLITKSGLKKLESELENLRLVKRQETAERIKVAREMGGVENNAEYDQAKAEQAFVEGRILTLETMLKNVEIIKPSSRRNRVGLGCGVLLQNQDGKIEQYTIVGKAEANPIEGKISNESLVGKALLGKKAGDTVKVGTPAGLLKLSVLEII